MLAVVLATGAALGWGTADFLGGLKSRSVAMLLVLLISQVSALILLAVIVLSIGEEPPASGFVFYAAIAGLAETLGVAALYRGLAVGKMSIVAPVASIAPAVPLVVGLLLGEVPTPMQFAGLALAVVGVVLTSRQRRTSQNADRSTSSSVLYGLLSALGFGIFFVGLDAASEGDIPWALLIARLTSVTAIAVAAILRRLRPAAPRSDLPAIVLIGALIVVADFMYATATTVGLLGVVAVIGALHTVVTVALARIVLHEQIERLQRLGIVACLGGVMILTAF
ncbi:MAG: EamA family transporter [Gammaproteobacteria bacterium]